MQKCVCVGGETTAETSIFVLVSKCQSLVGNEIQPIIKKSLMRNGKWILTDNLVDVLSICIIVMEYLVLVAEYVVVHIVLLG